ncbi:MAG TPA: GLPGLI family protein [Bacteroidia bacterium]|nr:GLPGLI family protein [Bacteroidia bacterium]
MKKIILTLSAVAIACFATAQTTGKIAYDEKVKLQIKLEGNGNEDMMNSLPKERTLQKELYFTQDASFYQNDKARKKSQDIEQTSGDGGQVMIKMNEPDDKVYCDLKNNKKIEQRDFMSRMFLIESDLKTMEWKMTGNQKMILNYPCQEAVLKDSAKKVVAWFTSAIPVSTGPNGYANLPGLILAADIDSGKVVITATTVDLKDFDAKIMVQPTEGKKVTKEQFEKIKKEKRKEMQQEFGGNGNVIIKVRN